MNLICPNKSDSKYKNLVKAYGDLDATAMFFANNYEIPTLNEAFILKSGYKLTDLDGSKTLGGFSEMRQSPSFRFINSITETNPNLKIQLGNGIETNLSNIRVVVDDKFFETKRYELQGEQLVEKPLTTSDAFYDRELGIIFIRKTTDKRFDTVLAHEAAHALITNLIKYNESYRDDLLSIVKSYKKEINLPSGYSNIELAEEIVVRFFTDSGFRDRLKNIKLKEKTEKRGILSLYDSIKRWIQNLFVKENLEYNETLYDEILDLSYSVDYDLFSNLDPQQFEYSNTLSFIGEEPGQLPFYFMSKYETKEEQQERAKKIWNTFIKKTRVFYKKEGDKVVVTTEDEGDYWNQFERSYSSSIKNNDKELFDYYLTNLSELDLVKVPQYVKVDGKRVVRKDESGNPMFIWMPVLGITKKGGQIVTANGWGKYATSLYSFDDVLEIRKYNDIISPTPTTLNDIYKNSNVENKRDWFEEVSFTLEDKTKITYSTPPKDEFIRHNIYDTEDEKKIEQSRIKNIAANTPFGSWITYKTKINGEEKHVTLPISKFYNDAFGVVMKNKKGEVFESIIPLYKVTSIYYNKKELTKAATVMSSFIDTSTGIRKLKDPEAFFSISINWYLDPEKAKKYDNSVIERAKEYRNKLLDNLEFGKSYLNVKFNIDGTTKTGWFVYVSTRANDVVLFNPLTNSTFSVAKDNILRVGYNNSNSKEVVARFEDSFEEGKFLSKVSPNSYEVKVFDPRFENKAKYYELNRLK